jgi:hypothetical protein
MRRERIYPFEFLLPLAFSPTHEILDPSGRRGGCAAASPTLAYPTYKNRDPLCVDDCPLYV